MLHVEHAAGLVGPLDEPPHPREVPGLPVRHGGVGDAGDQLAGPLHLVEEFTGIARLAAAGRLPPRHEVALVDFLPHRRADHVADRAGILPGRLQAAVDRVGVLLVVGEEFDHPRLVRQPVTVPEVGLVAEREHQRVPEPSVADRPLEREIERGLGGPRDVLGPLDLAVHPVDAFGDAGEHCGMKPQVPPDSTTHVSLLPPPWEELTTSDPFTSATLVRPPGSTKISSP